MELVESHELLSTLAGISPLAAAPLLDGPQLEAIPLLGPPCMTCGRLDDLEQNERQDAQHFLWQATQSQGTDVECHVAQVPDEAKDQQLTLYDGAG